MGKKSLKRKNYHSEKILELVHADLCRTIGIESYSGYKNFILVVDDYSIMMTTMYLKDKYEYFQKFKCYLARVEKETRKKLKCLRSDDVVN